MASTYMVGYKQAFYQTSSDARYLRMGLTWGGVMLMGWVAGGMAMGVEGSAGPGGSVDRHLLGGVAAAAAVGDGAPVPRVAPL